MSELLQDEMTLMEPTKYFERVHHWTCSKQIRVFSQCYTIRSTPTRKTIESDKTNIAS
jgi:hypothetical protein